MVSRFLISGLRATKRSLGTRLGQVCGSTDRNAKLALMHFAALRFKSTDPPKSSLTISRRFQPGIAQRDLKETRRVLDEFMNVAELKIPIPDLEPADQQDEDSSPTTGRDLVAQESWASGTAHLGYYVGRLDEAETLTILAILEPVLRTQNLFIEQLGGATGMLCVAALNRSAELALADGHKEASTPVIGATVHGALSVDVSRAATRIGHHYINNNPYLRNRIHVVEGDALSTPRLTEHKGPSLLIANRMITVLNLSESVYLTTTARKSMKSGDHLFLSYLLTEGREFSDTFTGAIVTASGLTQVVNLKVPGISTIQELYILMSKNNPQLVKENGSLSLRTKEALLEINKDACRIGYVLSDSQIYVDIVPHEGEGIFDAIRRQGEALRDHFATELRQKLIHNKDIESIEDLLKSIDYPVQESTEGTKYVLSKHTFIEISKDKSEASVRFFSSEGGYRNTTFRTKDYCEKVEGFEVVSTGRSKDLQLSLLKRT